MSSMNSKRGKLKPIDDDDFLKSGIESEEDINEIQFLLTTDAGTQFNTNVLRIALNMHEEKIASVIIARFPAKIDEDMILRAIKTSQIEFLQ